MTDKRAHNLMVARLIDRSYTQRVIVEPALARTSWLRSEILDINFDSIFDCVIDLAIGYVRDDKPRHVSLRITATVTLCDEYPSILRAIRKHRQEPGESRVCHDVLWYDRIQASVDIETIDAMYPQVRFVATPKGDL